MEHDENDGTFRTAETVDHGLSDLLPDPQPAPGGPPPEEVEEGVPSLEDAVLAWLDTAEEARPEVASPEVASPAPEPDPGAQQPGSEQQSGSDEQPAPEPTPDAALPAVASTPKRRRVSRKKVTAVAEAHLPELDVTLDAEPVETLPRRRRTKKAAAAAARSQQPVDPAVAERPVDQVPEPSATERPVVDPAVVDQPVVEQPVVEQPVVEQPAMDQPAKASVDGPTTTPPTSHGGTPQPDPAAAANQPEQAPAGAFGVSALFQAPVASPPRRRRAASRPAGPPQPSTIAAVFTPPTEADVGTQADETTESAEPPTAPADSQALDDVGQADPTVSGAGEVVDAPESREPESMEAVEVGPGREESAHADPAEVSESIAEGDSPTVDDPDGAEATDDDGPRRRRRRGGRGRRRRTGDDERPETEQPNGGDPADDEASASPTAETDSDDETEAETGSSRRRRRRRRRAGGDDGASPDDPPNTVVRVRQSRRDDVTGLKGSTRLEAKRQRRREGRESGRRRQVVTEAEFLARRESVDRAMLVRDRDGRTQIVVLEDDVLVEHYVARKSAASMIGNIYLGKVQNVLPSMEAAFIDIGKGRNAVLYAGEVNWDAAGLAGQPRRIELALKAGDPVLAQVSKDPVGHKGARLTSQVSLPGRYLVYVPNSSITGISRKLPDTERNRLKRILRAVVPEEAGVIVRTAAEGASEDELRRDVERLQRQWAEVEKRAKAVSPPTLLHGEPDLTIKVIRDVFNEDFKRLVVSGEEAWNQVSSYVEQVAPDLSDRVSRWDGDGDIFAAKRIDEQIAKGLERKVWLPSGGSLVIDRTEAMTVVDVNTGKFVGAGGNLEETVTRNNLEAAEEIVRQLRLRDIGGIIVVDFIDMVLESNRDLVLRRLIECLGRDRTKHQVAEVTSLGLVQMTRKRVGQGLLESFSDPCEACGGRGVHLHEAPSQPTATPRQEAPRRGHFEAQRVAEAARKAKEREVAKLGGTAEQSDEAPTVEAPTVEAPTEEAAAVEAATGDQAAGQTPSAEGAPPQDHQDHQDRSGPDDSEPAEPAQLGGELLDSGSGGEPHAAGTEVRADDRPEPAGDPDHAGTGAEAPDAGAAGTAPSSPPPPTRPGGSADTVAVGFESAPDVSETPDEPDQPGESEQTTHTDPGPPV